MHVGDEASLERRFSADYINAFAELSGDANPLHADDGFAKHTRFGAIIAQGMLVASLISAVIGTKLPGPGSVYLSQSLEFLAPVFAGDRVTASVRVKDVRKDGRIVVLDTWCEKANGETVLKGDAVILLDETKNGSRPDDASQ